MMNRIFGNLSDVCVKRNEQSHPCPESSPRRRIRTGTGAKSGGGLSDTEDA